VLPSNVGTAASADIVGVRLVTALAGGDPNGDITEASVSADGRWLVFSSDAENLTDDDGNFSRDIFVKDLEEGTITLLSKLPELGGQTDADSYEPVICGDGSIVAFTTDSDLLDLDDNDFNGEADVYVIERDANDTGIFDEFEEPGGVRITRVSVGVEGLETDFGANSPAISDDCEWVAFVAIDPLSDDDFNDGEDVYVRSLVDLPAEIEDFEPPVLVTKSANVGNPLGGGGVLPGFSADGRYVTFASTGADLATGPDAGLGGIFVHDRDVDGNGIYDESGQTRSVHVSVQPNGRASTGVADTSVPAQITPDGRCVAFRFNNGFDISEDVTQSQGVFVHDRDAGTTTLVSVGSTGLQAIEAAGPSISPDCRYAGFDSGDPNVVPGDTNGARDAFVRDLQSNRTALLSQTAGGSPANGFTVVNQVLADNMAILTSSASEIGGAGGGSGALDAFLVEFELAPQFALTVNRAGAGNGSVLSNPAGINCGATCEAVFDGGTQVTLTANAMAGSMFAGWSGACLGTGTCRVTMSKARTVTATFVPTVAGFNDVPANAFYADAVAWLKLFDITTGFGGNPTTFAPNVAVNRGQMAAFLWRMMDQPAAPGGHTFTDVPPTAFFNVAVAWLLEKGITTGFGGSPTTFAPNVVVNRGQMAAFLWRMAGSPSVPTGHTFADVPSTAFFDQAVAWLLYHGITTGFGGSSTTFAPNVAVNRGQMAAFLYRLASTPAAWDASITLPSSVVKS
jgi:Tol biopolymer transport system component